MKTTFKRIAICLAILFLPLTVYADILVLKDGSEIETTYYWKDDGVTIGYYQDGDTKYIKDNLIDWQKTKNSNRAAASESAASGSATTAGSDSSGNFASDDACIKTIHSRAASYLRDEGYGDAEIYEVAMDAPSHYLATGTCYDPETGQFRNFRITYKCNVKKIHGKIWVEGSTQPITQTVESSFLSFDFTE